MTDKEGGADERRAWPDMRSLRWPPEGVELAPEAKSRPDDVPPPVEFAADPAGSGELMAVPVGGLPPESAGEGERILAEVRALRLAVDGLARTVRALTESGRVGAPGGPQRSISDHQGRQEIQEYFLKHPGRTVYPKEIAEALNLPVLKVAELCEMLALRGQLSRNAGS